MLCSVIIKHLLQMRQPLYDNLTFWLASHLQMEIDPLKDVYYLLCKALVVNSLLTTFVL